MKMLRMHCATLAKVSIQFLLVLLLLFKQHEGGTNQLNFLFLIAGEQKPVLGMV